MGGRAKVAAVEAKSMMAMDVSDAMAMLLDEDKTKKFFTQIAVLKGEIAKDLEAIGTAEQIDRLLLKTRNNHTMSEEELTGVRTEAAATRAAADSMHAEAKLALEDAGAQAVKLIEDADAAAKKQTAAAVSARKAAENHERETAEIVAATTATKKENKLIHANMLAKLAKAQELVDALQA